MNFRKKAIASHLIILIIVSLIMGSFVFAILEVFYADDAPKCQLIKYNIENLCKTSSDVAFDIDNVGNSILRFKIPGESNEFSVPSLGRESFKIKKSSNDLEIKIFFKQGVNEVSCKSISEKINLDKVKRC